MSNSRPYVQAAIFCNQILEEKDGTLSAIRIVDRWFATRPTPGNPVASVSLMLLVMLKSGSVRGSHDIQIHMEQPDGGRDEGSTFTAFFEGEDRGVNIILPVTVQAEEEGLYWFDVEIDESILTRVPLRVVFHTPQTGQRIDDSGPA